VPHTGKNKKNPNKGKRQRYRKLIEWQWRHR
jgi:hypothetical protein